jgi:hypothetical protein
MNKIIFSAHKGKIIVGAMIFSAVTFAGCSKSSSPTSTSNSDSTAPTQSSTTDYMNSNTTPSTNMPSSTYAPTSVNSKTTIDQDVNAESDKLKNVQQKGSDVDQSLNSQNKDQQ